MPVGDYDRFFGGKKGAAAKARAGMIDEYGLKRGMQVFHATVDRKRKQRGGKGDGLRRALR